MLIGLGAVFLTGVPSAAAASGSQESPLDWPIIRGDLHNTGSSDGPINSTHSREWTFNADDTLVAVPVEEKDTVYLGSHDSRFYALNASTGVVRWTFGTGERIKGSAGVEEGRVYFGSVDSNLYALNTTDGSLVWSFSTGSRVVSNPLVYNQTVYFGSHDSNIYALDAETGDIEWRFSTEGRVKNTVAIANETVFAIPKQDAKVYAIDAETGQTHWTRDLASGGISPLYDKGRLFLPLRNGNITALNASDGSLLWSKDHKVRGGLALKDGFLSFGSRSKEAKAIHPENGTLIWKTKIGQLGGTPTAVDDRLYIGGKNGTHGADATLFALTLETGEILWREKLNGSITAPSYADGSMYATAESLYAFSIGPDLEPPQAPQDFGVGPGDTLREADLRWEAPEDSGSSALSHYNIYRGTSAESLTKVAQTTDTAHTDTALACETTYYYEVTAVDEDGLESEPTETKSIVTGCPLKIEVTDVEPAGGPRPDVDTTVHLRVVNDGDHSLSSIEASAALVQRPTGSQLGRELVTPTVGHIPAGGSASFQFQFTPDEPGQYTLRMAAAPSLDDDGAPAEGASPSTKAQVNLPVEGATTSVSSQTFLSPCDEDFWTQDDFLLIHRPDCEKFGNDERVSFPNTPNYFLPGELLAVKVAAHARSPVDWSDLEWSTDPAGVLSFVTSSSQGDSADVRTLFYEVEIDLRHELGSQGRRQVSLNLELPLESGETIPASADVPLQLSKVKFGFRGENLPAPEGNYRFSGLAMAAEDGVIGASEGHWNSFSFHSKGWKQRERPIHATQGGGSVLDTEDTEWSCESLVPFRGCDSNDRLFRKAVVEGGFEEGLGQNEFAESSGTELPSKTLHMARCSGPCKMIPPTVSVFNLRPVLLETSVPSEVEKGERYALYLRVLGGNPQAPHAVFNVKAHLEADGPIRFAESGTDSITLSRFAAGGRAENQGSPAHFTLPIRVLDEEESSADITVTLETRPRGSDEWLGPTTRSFSLQLEEGNPGTADQILDVYQRRLEATEASWDHAAGKTMDTSWDGLSRGIKTLIGFLASESLHNDLTEVPIDEDELAQKTLRPFLSPDKVAARTGALGTGIDAAFTIGETSGSAIDPHGAETLRKNLPLPPTEEEFKKGGEVVFDPRKSTHERIGKAAGSLARLDKLQGIYQLSRIKTGSALHWAPAPANPDPFPPFIVNRDAAFGHAGTTSRCDLKPNHQGLFSSPRPFFSHPAVQAAQTAFSFSPSAILQGIDKTITGASLAVDFGTAGTGITSLHSMHCVAQKGSLLPGSVQTFGYIGPNATEQTDVPVHNDGSNLTIRITRPARVNLTVNLTAPNGTDATSRLSTRQLNGSLRHHAEIEDAAAGNWTITVTAGPDANATWYTTYGRQTHPGLTPHTFRLLDPQGQPVPANLTLSTDAPLTPVKKSIGRGTFETKLPANATVNYTATAHAYAPLAGTLNASEIGNTTVQRLDPHLTFANTTARFTNAPVWNHTVNVSNTGPTDLQLNVSVTASGPLEAALDQERLNLSAGESEPVRINTASLGRGNHTTQLTLTDASTGDLVRSTTLSLEGREAQLNLTPGAIRQAIEKGTNRTLNATVTNVGDAPAPNLTVEHQGPQWLEVQANGSDLPAGATANLTVTIDTAGLENATMASTTVWVNHSFESRPVPVTVAAFEPANETTLRQGLLLPQASEWTWNVTVNESGLSVVIEPPTEGSTASIETGLAGETSPIGFETDALRVAGPNGTVARHVENASLGRLDEGVLLSWSNETADRIVRVSVTRTQLDVTPFVGIQNATFGADGLGLLEGTIRSGPDLLGEGAVPFLRLGAHNLTASSTVQPHQPLTVENFRNQAPAVPPRGARVAGTVTYDGPIGTVLQQNESAVLVRHIEDAPAEGTEVSVRVTPRLSAALSQTLGDALGWTAIDAGDLSEPAPRVDLATLDREFEDNGNRRVSVLGEVTATNATHRNLTVLAFEDTTGHLFADWSTANRTLSEGDWVAATGVLAQRNVSTTNTTQISTGLVPTSFAFDQESPQTEARPTGTRGAGPWFRSTVNLSLDAQDDIAGVDTTFYRISGSENWSIYTGPVQIGHGIHPIEYYSQDRAGRAEDISEVTVQVDRGLPNATANGTDLVRRELSHPVTGETVRVNGSVPVVVALGNTSTNATLRDGLSGLRSAAFVVGNQTACQAGFNQSGRLQTGPGDAFVQCQFDASKWEPGLYDGTWLVTDVAGNPRFEGSPDRDVLVVVLPGSPSETETASPGPGPPASGLSWLGPLLAVSLAGVARGS